MILESLLVSAPDWAIRHAPVMIPVVPLIMAPVLALSPSGRLSWFLAMVATAASFYFALLTLGIVQSTPGGIIEYWIGNWYLIGIEFRVDALNAMILLLISGIGFLASIFAWPTIVAEVQKQKMSLFLSAFLLCFAGLCGVAATGDAFNLFVFLEISSLSTYVLVAMGAGRDRRALPAMARCFRRA